TSRYEGYPLATLESMSHGCPVISYDLKYGPRDQILDGVDGFLVAEGDVRAMADRMVELIRSPQLVAKMSTAARDKAAAHSPEAFVRDWKQVLDTVVANKPTRIRLGDGSVRVRRVGYVRPGTRRRLKRLAPGTAEHVIALDAVLRFTRPPVPDEAVVSLDAIDVTSGEVAPVEVSVGRKGNGCGIQGRLRLSELSACSPLDVRLRLRLVARSAVWQQDLARVREDEHGCRVSQAPG